MLVQSYQDTHTDKSGRGRSGNHRNNVAETGVVQREEEVTDVVLRKLRPGGGKANPVKRGTGAHSERTGQPRSRALSAPGNVTLGPSSQGVHPHTYLRTPEPQLQADPWELAPVSGDAHAQGVVG